MSPMPLATSTATTLSLLTRYISSREWDECVCVPAIDLSYIPAFRPAGNKVATATSSMPKRTNLCGHAARVAGIACMLHDLDSGTFSVKLSRSSISGPRGACVLD